MRSKSKSPLPPAAAAAAPTSSWGFGHSRAPSRLEEVAANSDSDDGGRWNNASNRFDDEGYDSPAERERQKKKDEQRKRRQSRLLPRNEADNFDHSNVSSRFKEQLKQYRAVKIGLFKNGDPWFGAINFHFLPGRDVTSLDSLFKSISPKLDLMNGVSFMFDTDGGRITSLDQIRDNCAYVCSSSRKFIPGNYGAFGDAFASSINDQRASSRLSNRQTTTNLFKTSSAPSTSSGSSSRVIERERRHLSSEGGGIKSGGKPNSADGRVIRIVNADDQDASERVLLNLKTSQPFEEVLIDLGQVLKIRRARLMCTKDGLEVKSFSQLRNIFSRENIFLISPFRNKVTYTKNYDEDDEGDDLRKNILPTKLSRRNSEPSTHEEDFTRSPSRAHSDQGPQSGPADRPGGSEPIKVTIKGDRKLFYPPSNGYRKIVQRPKSKMVLDWVYGCKGTDTVSRNLWVLSTGELAYFVSTVGVIYNRIEETQRHYRGHTEEIQCMDVLTDKNYALSGQRAGKIHESRAHVRLWNVVSLETMCVLGFGEYELGVSGVAFSATDSSKDVLLCGVDGGGEDHILSVWQWDSEAEKAPLLGRVATRAEFIRGVSFHPLDNHLVITYGRGHLTFWNRRKDGFFDRSDMVRDDRCVCCVAFLESGDVVAGDDSGAVRTYSVSNEGEYYMSGEFEAHQKGVASIMVLGDGTVVTGGERDRKLITWDATRDFAMGVEIKLPDGVGSVRSISRHNLDQDNKDASMYVGTTKNCILEGSAVKKALSVTIWGHSKRLDGVAVHPDDLAFVTAGYDKVVAKWRKQKVIWKVSAQSECVSAAYHPSASTVAIGTLDGHVVVLNAETGVLVTTVRVCAAPINAIVFNKTGEQLACASNTGIIYTFKCSRDGYTLKREQKAAVSNVALVAVDWSEDSNYLAAVTADFNMGYVEAKSHRVERNGVTLRDQTWLDQTATLGYNVAGTWNNIGYKNDPTTTTAVSVGNHRTKLAAGDAHGNLRLFQYPCTTSRAEFQEEKTASSAITSIRFLFEDMYIITTGGADATLMRWKVV